MQIGNQQQMMPPAGYPVMGGPMGNPMQIYNPMYGVKQGGKNPRGVGPQYLGQGPQKGGMQQTQQQGLPQHQPQCLPQMLFGQSRMTLPGQQFGGGGMMMMMPQKAQGGRSPGMQMARQMFIVGGNGQQGQGVMMPAMMISGGMQQQLQQGMPPQRPQGGPQQQMLFGQIMMTFPC